MKLTVIPDDGAVYLDNVSYDHLDMTGVPTEVHALQWKETFGWIEFKDSAEQNAQITELPEWALALIPLWDAAKLAEKAASNKQYTASVNPLPVTIL